MEERAATPDIARAIIDANRYMTIGSADADGTPWATPVWFAPDGYREFFWVSSPDARHSRNIAVRPRVSIVIFDSQVPEGEGQAVYMSALAEQLDGDERERGIGIFSRHSEVSGAGSWTSSDVLPPARLRLYRARVDEWFVLGERDERVPLTLD
jgi:nitroimidazol reductase NimA-like FMN-containing flavoprotein (pyridoxamine 5'-phosphate oxidase superfamily)